MQLLVYFLSTATQLVTDRKKSRPFLLIHLIFITLKFLSTINVNRHFYNIILHLGFPVGLVVKNLPVNTGDTGMWGQYRRHRDVCSILGSEDPLEKEMAIHSSILAWRIPWTEEPSGLQSTGSQGVGHGWSEATKQACFVCPVDSQKWLLQISFSFLKASTVSLVHFPWQSYIPSHSENRSH